MYALETRDLSTARKPSVGDDRDQIEVLNLLYSLNASKGRTIVMVLHDINLACRYAHHIVAIQDQQVYIESSPEEVVTSSMI
ncbi:ABC transporter ATP-binding protein [Cohnella luojiensis]|uniref:ABC transporter ATP-binding protein n=1 Tax=Cohnella luojiensis TaxID=652876 RepID=A0A4Y8LTV2_9BACL|nr:ABC transporter ATP-binding protein [Cohnella luojiensis]